MKVYLILLVILFATEINAYQEKTELKRNQLQHNRFIQFLTQNIMNVMSLEENGKSANNKQKWRHLSFQNRKKMLAKLSTNKYKSRNNF